MSAIKMDELLVSWLGRDDVYEMVMELIETYRSEQQQQLQPEEEKKETEEKATATTTANVEDEIVGAGDAMGEEFSSAATQLLSPTPLSAPKQLKSTASTPSTKTMTTIPPFYPVKVAGRIRKRRQLTVSQKDTWDPLPLPLVVTASNNASAVASTTTTTKPMAAAPLLPQLLDGYNPSKINPSSKSVSSDPSNSEHNNPKKGNASSKDNSNDKNIALSSTATEGPEEPSICVRDQTMAIYADLGQDPPLASPTSDDDDDDFDLPAVVADTGGAHSDVPDPHQQLQHQEQQLRNKNKRFAQKYLTVETFVRITKDVCGFPSFFNVPLYARILYLWNTQQAAQMGPPSVHAPMEVITLEMMEWFWKTEMEPYDPCDRFFRLVAQVQADAIVRDDFLPFIKALLQDHPGLEFLSTHAEFQEKYAVTVITRIFYGVNTCHSGRITARQVRKSDLLEAFQQVDEEEDINKVPRYFSYEHFYVLYCRFWELDHDRDYRITREDLLKYGDQALSHMIVDRIFDAAPRPFEPQQQHQQHLLLQQQQQQSMGNPQQQLQPMHALSPSSQQQQQRPSHRDYLSYEDFIYFMLSEEDKSNEVSVKYWFTCVDVDGDGKLNNMELRSFYAVQLHRMQFMGHEMVPFEDMLCQMMDMIKPAHDDYLVESDFLQPECRQVSGALFDALFNLNKYLQFEQRDPFAERQKREDEFDCDWDRFACLDYSRLAMEEEAREEEAMEIDWVTVDDDDDDDDDEEDDDDDDDDGGGNGRGDHGNQSNNNNHHNSNNNNNNNNNNHHHNEEEEEDDGADSDEEHRVGSTSSMNSSHRHHHQQQRHQQQQQQQHILQQQQQLHGGLGGGHHHTQSHHHHHSGGGGGHHNSSHSLHQQQQHSQHHLHHPDNSNNIHLHHHHHHSLQTQDDDDLQHTDDDSENDLYGTTMSFMAGQNTSGTSGPQPQVRHSVVSQSQQQQQHPHGTSTTTTTTTLGSHRASAGMGVAATGLGGRNVGRHKKNTNLRGNSGSIGGGMSGGGGGADQLNILPTAASEAPF